MSRTATTLIVLLILLVGTAANASAQSGGEDESVTLIDSTVHFSESHPVFIRILCMKASCPGLQLKVSTPQGNYSVEDPIRVELSFHASGNVSFQLTADQVLLIQSEWLVNIQKQGHGECVLKIIHLPNVVLFME